MQQEDEKILQRWKTTNQLSPHTFKNYKSVIQHYTKCTQMTIAEAHQQARQEEEEARPRYRRQSLNHSRDYYIERDSS